MKLYDRLGYDVYWKLMEDAAEQAIVADLIGDMRFNGTDAKVTAAGYRSAAFMSVAGQKFREVSHNMTLAVVALEHLGYTITPTA